MDKYLYILIRRDKKIMGIYTDEETARDMARFLGGESYIDIYEYLVDNIDK